MTTNPDEIDDRIGVSLNNMLDALRAPDRDKALELLDRALRCAVYSGEHKGTVESLGRVEKLIDEVLLSRSPPVGNA